MLMVNEAVRSPQRWVFDSITVYASNHAAAEKVYQAIAHQASQGERMGVYALDNGDRVAWVRLQQKGKDGPDQE